MSSTLFEFNEFGVCVNPEKIFFTMKKGALAWDYVEIRIAKRNDEWYYGASYGGGGSPCSKGCIDFKTKEDVILSAYKDVKERLLKQTKNVDAFSKNSKLYLNELNKWFLNRNQVSLTLF